MRARIILSHADGTGGFWQNTLKGEEKKKKIYLKIEGWGPIRSKKRESSWPRRG